MRDSPVFSFSRDRPDIEPRRSLVSAVSTQLPDRARIPVPGEGLPELLIGLREDQERSFGVVADQSYCLTSGGCSSLFVALSRLAGRRGRVAIFSEQEGYYVPILRRFGFSVESVSFSSVASSKASVFLFSNPVLPQGRTLTKGELERTVQDLVGAGTVPVVDERFWSLGYERPVVSVRSMVCAAECVVVDSFTHRGCLQDFPVGFVSGAEEIVRDISSLVSGMGVGPTLASQLMASLFLEQHSEDRRFQKMKLQHLGRRLRQIVSGFSQDGFYGLQVPEAGPQVSGRFSSTLPYDGVVKTLSDNGFSLPVYPVSKSINEFAISLYTGEHTLQEGIPELASLIRSISEPSAE